MLDSFRYIYKHFLVPLLEFALRVTPRRLRALIFVSIADSLRLKNVRFDFPFRLDSSDSENESYINIGHFPGDRSVTPFLIHKTNWEVSEPRAVVQNLEGGNSYVLFDVGANFGYFSLQLLSILDASGSSDLIKKAYLIEPDPSVFRILQKNCDSFEPGKERFHLVQKALGVQAGMATFYIDRGNKTNNSLSKRAMGIASEGVDEIRVEVIGVSSLLEELPVSGEERIIFKTDLQGTDIEVVSNIPDRLRNRIDLLIFEIWPRFLPPDALISSNLKQILSQFDNLMLEDDKGNINSTTIATLSDQITSASKNSHFNLFCSRTSNP